MCSKKCSLIKDHRENECRIFKEKGYKADGKNFDFQSKSYIQLYYKRREKQFFIS